MSIIIIIIIIIIISLLCCCCCCCSSLFGVIVYDTSTATSIPISVPTPTSVPTSTLISTTTSAPVSSTSAPTTTRHITTYPYPKTNTNTDDGVKANCNGQMFLAINNGTNFGKNCGSAVLPGCENYPLLCYNNYDNANYTSWGADTTTSHTDKASAYNAIALPR